MAAGVPFISAAKAAWKAWTPPGDDNTAANGPRLESVGDGWTTAGGRGAAPAVSSCPKRFAKEGGMPVAASAGEGRWAAAAKPSGTGKKPPGFAAGAAAGIFRGEEAGGALTLALLALPLPRR
jgi:hypothetical protein